MSRLRLEKEEEIAVFLRLVVVREHALLDFGGIVEVAGDFVLLQKTQCQHTSNNYDWKE
jgi:hypothetical protein